MVGPDSPVAWNQGLLNGIPMWRNLTMDADHPLTSKLLADAGVSAERLDFPLVTFLRADHILLEDELSPIISAFTNHHVFSVLPFIKHYKWFEEMTDRLNAARNAVRYEVGVQPERSVVVFNTGPHWNTGELGPEMTDEELTEAYRRVVSEFLYIRVGSR